MFKKGDKVVKKDGGTFSNGEKEVTVTSHDIDSDMVWLEETNTFIQDNFIELAHTEEENKVENEKLIVNEPAFNKKAIKEGMFIIVKYQRDNFTVSSNGIITNVHDKSITYVVVDKKRVETRTVSLDAVVNGRAQIQVADNLPAEVPQSAILKHVGLTYGGDPLIGATLLIDTVEDRKVGKVVLNGNVYLKAPNAHFRPFVTDYIKGEK